MEEGTVGKTSKSGGRANEGDKVFVVGWEKDVVRVT